VEPLYKAVAKERQITAGERGKEGGRGKKKNPSANGTRVKQGPRSADKVAKGNRQEGTHAGEGRGSCRSGGRPRSAYFKGETCCAFAPLLGPPSTSAQL
jgi:hypothetical protein